MSDAAAVFSPALQYKTWTVCRVCGGSLIEVLPLGPTHVSAFPLPTEPESLTTPLTLCRCEQCGLVQLSVSVDPAYLYQEYWYRSGVNETMVAELQDVVKDALSRVTLAAGDSVVDIGANDGTLLAAYGDQPAVRVAYEPAANLQESLAPHADICVPHAFPGKGYRLTKPRAKIVTSIACFYDLDDPGAFAAEVQRILHPDGVWIIQFQDLHQMLQATAFDNICHEHVTYLSLAAVERIIAPHDLVVVDVQERAINGGSLRIVVQHAGKPLGRSIIPSRCAEAFCESWVALESFAHRVRERRAQIRATLDHLVTRGHVVDLYGASTKGNTLLQYCGLTGRQIRQAWERSPEKVGRRTAGTGIPIVSEEVGRRQKPDALLVGIWQFREALLQREAAFLAQGRPIILPLPAVEVVMGGRHV